MIVYSLFWYFLFSITSKKERNFCFSTKDNQFDACSYNQICQDHESKINIIIYENGNWDINDFYNETMYINQKYANFFVQISNHIYIKNVYSKYQLNLDNSKFIAVIVLSSREKYNIPLRYHSLCETRNFNIIMVIMSAIGGILGSITLNVCSDIFGRKIIIIITLGMAFLSTLSLCIFFFVLDAKENKYKTNDRHFVEFNDILHLYYSQFMISAVFRKFQYFLFVVAFLLSFALYPLKISILALLMENSLNDYYSLYGYRLYNFAECGLGPFLGMIICIKINDLRYSFLFYAIMFLILMICSYFLLYESMRHLFEYCEWEKLTTVALKCLTDLKETDFSNEGALETHKILNENSGKKSIANVKLLGQIEIQATSNTQRKSLIRSIKQNTNYMVKKVEVAKYPYIIFLCMIGNPLISKSVGVLLQICPEFSFIFSIYRFEALSITFFPLPELYENIVVNSSFFIILFIIYVSGFVYFCLWRIMTFKRVIIFNIFVVTFFLLLYDLFFTLAPTTYKDLNRYNNSQKDLYLSESNLNQNKNYLYVVIFFCNGLKMFENLLLLKYSKTLFRCTFLGCITILEICSFVIVFFLSLAFQRLAMFSIIGIISILFSILYVNQAGEQAYLISDIKRTLSTDKKKK